MQLQGVDPCTKHLRGFPRVGQRCHRVIGRRRDSSQIPALAAPCRNPEAPSHRASTNPPGRDISLGIATDPHPRAPFSAASVARPGRRYLSPIPCMKVSPPPPDQARRPPPRFPVIYDKPNPTVVRDVSSPSIALARSSAHPPPIPSKSRAALSSHAMCCPRPSVQTARSGLCPAAQRLIRRSNSPLSHRQNLDKHPLTKNCPSLSLSRPRAKRGVKIERKGHASQKSPSFASPPFQDGPALQAPVFLIQV